jgi:thiamine-phosphate pyrophosphorylase
MIRYYITDRHSAGGTDQLLCFIQRAITQSIDRIQIREKDLSARDLFLLTKRALELAAGSITRILVNGRVDVALASGAHGVHLPAYSISPSAIRTITPPGFLIGVSTHSKKEIHTAQIEGADFVVYGPVFAPNSKASYTAPVGLEGLTEAVRGHTLEVLALGGITQENAAACVQAGAAGIAAISLFQR